MTAAQQHPTDAGRAAQALSRSGLSVVRVPDDLDTLAELGLVGGKRGIRALIRLGLLRPVARGIYEVRNPSGVSRSSFERLLAARFAGRLHLATGWWALAAAGLTSQDVRDVVVLAATKHRDFEATGRRAHIVKAAAGDLWGGKKRPSGLVVASPERALCDCAGRPSTRIPASRLAEAVDTFLRTDPAAASRLVAAVDRFRSPVAARRLGYIVELTAGEEAAAPYREMLGSSHRADALDPGDEGAPIVSRWLVRTRLHADELLEHRRVS